MRRTWSWIRTHKLWSSVIAVVIWSWIDIGDVSIGLLYAFFVGVIKVVSYIRRHRTTKEVK